LSTRSGNTQPLLFATRKSGCTLLLTGCSNRQTLFTTSSLSPSDILSGKELSIRAVQLST
jgi:hypothetical protein